MVSPASASCASLLYNDDDDFTLRTNCDTYLVGGPEMAYPTGNTLPDFSKLVNNNLFSTPIFGQCIADTYADI